MFFFLMYVLRVLNTITFPKKKKKSLEITFEILAENFFYPQRCLSNLIIFDHINFIYAKNHDKVRI